MIKSRVFKRHGDVFDNNYTEPIHKDRFNVIGVDVPEYANHIQFVFTGQNCTEDSLDLEEHDLFLDTDFPKNKELTKKQRYYHVLYW